MNIEVLLKNISTNLAHLEKAGNGELVAALRSFTATIEKETSDTLDREALLKQIEILSEQATLPSESRKQLLITSALYYLSLFSVVPSVGSFLIRNREKLARYFGL